MDKDAIDPKVYDLYDEYCHSMMDRREFLRRASAMVVVGGSGLLMARALLPDYASAQMISFTDKRIKARYVEYDSPGGTSGKMRGYLVQPAGAGPFPAVVVIHENRGLNPHIEDVARRAAVEGFLALAPDGLAPIGGYPGNDDDGKKMQRSLDRGKLRTDLLNSARYVKATRCRTGNWGLPASASAAAWSISSPSDGKRSERLRPVLWPRPKTADVAKIKAALLINYAGNDPRINKMAPGLHGGSEGQRRDARGAYLSRNAPRLSQQFDAALRRSRREACVGADGRLLQEASVVVDSGTIPTGGKPAALWPPV